MKKSGFISWTAGSIDLSEVYVRLPCDVFGEILMHSGVSDLRQTKAWCRNILEDGVKSNYGFLIIDGDSYPEISNEKRQYLTKTLVGCFGTPVVHRSAHLKQDVVCDVRDHGYRFKSFHDQTFHSSNQEAIEHTDSSELQNPVSVFLLSVINPAYMGGATRLVSVYALHEVVRQRYKEYLPILEKEYIFDTGRGEKIRAPILSYDVDGRINFRWMRAFLENGKQHTKHWDDHTDHVFDAVTLLMQNLRVELTLKRGDVGIFNNKALLHARDSFEDSPRCPPRWMLRAWVK